MKSEKVSKLLALNDAIQEHFENIEYEITALRRKFQDLEQAIEEEEEEEE